MESAICKESAILKYWLGVLEGGTRNISGFFWLQVTESKQLKKK